MKRPDFPRPGILFRDITPLLLDSAGLDAATAMRLARATVQGAGALMAARPESPPDLLRRNVTSPGGTTAAALDVLMAEGGLAPLMVAAVAAAKRRAGELAG